MAEQLAPPTTEAVPPPSPQEQRKRRLIIAGLIAFAVLIIAVIVGGTILAYQHPDGTKIARDLAIIILAILSIGISIMVILLLYQVTMLTLLM